MKILMVSIALGAFFFTSCRKEPVGCFSVQEHRVKVDEMVLFQDCSENVTDYLWDFGDGNESDVVSPVHFYNKRGHYEVKLKGYSENYETVWATGSIVVVEDHFKEVIIKGVIDVPEIHDLRLNVYTTGERDTPSLVQSPVIGQIEIAKAQVTPSIIKILEHLTLDKGSAFVELSFHQQHSEFVSFVARGIYVPGETKRFSLTSKAPELKDVLLEVTTEIYD